MTWLADLWALVVDPVTIVVALIAIYVLWTFHVAQSIARDDQNVWDRWDDE